ncbi:hypothetical protein HDU87_008471 [Geranomyces variabilis]|uniref:Uncharacterized protein n=1 Tax=Geranomyces variabilis TaxID=109894 RepID=A0AAD5TPC7_9FUNG|nr:hypothetical protein HDU87_008471 [Geranomyces variabilis]
MAAADQISLRRRPGATVRGGTDLSGFLHRLRATVVSAPPSALGPAPTRPGDALVMRLNRAQAAAASMRSHETAEQLTQHAARIQQLRFTTAEEQKVMQSAARSLRTWIEEKQADVVDPAVLEGVKTTLNQVDSGMLPSAATKTLPI